MYFLIYVALCVFFFFFKQKTAYEMRISDWSSDVCSSDLILARDAEQAEALDGLLWEFDADAWLPHQIAGSDEDDDITPILIVVPGTDTPDRPLVINLRDAIAPGQSIGRAHV